MNAPASLSSWWLGGMLVAAAAVGGWYLWEGRWNRKLFASAPGRIRRNIRVREARQFLREHPETLVLDVRSAAEHAAGSLPGAVNFPFQNPAFESQAAALDPSRPLLVYCAGGYRSRQAVARLNALAFSNIQHLHRGYHSWRLAGFPVERAGRMEKLTRD